MLAEVRREYSCYYFSITSAIFSSVNDMHVNSIFLHLIRSRCSSVYLVAQLKPTLQHHCTGCFTLTSQEFHDRFDGRAYGMLEKCIVCITHGTRVLCQRRQLWLWVVSAVDHSFGHSLQLLVRVTCLSVDRSVLLWVALAHPSGQRRSAA